MRKVRAVDLLVDRVVPPDMRDQLQTYSAKEVNNFLLDLSRKYPDQYADISHKLAQVGLKTSYLQGDSMGFNDLEPVIDRDHVFQKMDREVDDLRKEHRNDPEEFDRQREGVWMKYNDLILKTTMDAASKQHNAMGMAVASGSRGKPQQVQAMLSTPGLYQDHNGKVIPIFVRNSFADGLRPMELMSGTFGARSAVVSTKRCLHVDTKVLMADGSVKCIRDIKIGDQVMGSNKSGHVFPTTVKAVYDQGLQEVNRYTFSYSDSNAKYVVDCTEDHKFLLNDKRTYRKHRSQCKGPIIEGSTSTSDHVLAYRERVIAPIGPNTTVSTFATFPESCIEALTGTGVDEALFLGLMTGDGGMAQTKSNVTFAASDKSLVEQVDPYFMSLGIKMRATTSLGLQYVLSSVGYTGKDQTSRRLEDGSGKFGTDILSTPKIILSKYALLGKYSYQKELPTGIHEWDIDSISKYLAGLIITDGSVVLRRVKGKDRLSVSFCSTSRALVDGVVHLLERRFQIYPGSVFVKTNGGFSGEQRRPLYYFSVHKFLSLKNFDKWIAPHLLGVKREKWLIYWDKNSLDRKSLYKKARLVKTEPLGLLPCMDLEVEHEDHLFVLGNGIITSNSTAQGGDIGKLMGQATSRLVITEKDCGVRNGLSYDLDNNVLPGRILSRPAGDYKAGTILDRNSIQSLRKAGIKSVVARSPLTCKADGLCSKCVGIMLDKDTLPRIGDHVGATAAQASSEPLAQGALSMKHVAGQASLKSGYGGLDVVSQFVQSPEEYQHRATVSNIQGKVEQILEAPQGGTIVKIQGEDHYVPQGYAPLVGVGDDLDEGDQISEGLMDVRDVVRHKGLGEGRKYYADRLGEIYKDSGLPYHPKNMEIVARGALNTVTMDDYMDGLDALPDDAVDYNKVVRAWEPQDEQLVAADNASRNRYLSRDVLHYTAGTKLNKAQLKNIRDAGIETIHTVGEKPPFTSNMDRLRVASHYNDDWLASMSSSYLKKQLGEGATRGADTDVYDNQHWAPRIAYGKGFAENVRETGHF